MRILTPSKHALHVLKKKKKCAKKMNIQLYQIISLILIWLYHKLENNIKSFDLWQKRSQLMEVV